ncbi:GNAT family N-acetyltransferase [Brevibacillus sp. FSL L8-0520]|uniref:GNAT family N-acetyltransferase n=1 Tax=Brevibacillus sp. FSL L8-0520 TaxID=2954689 RepID=UPI0030D4C2C6
MIIRSPRPEETPALSDLAFRSKGYWSYDDDFMEACRQELTITPAFLQTSHVFLAEEAGNILGFYRLSVDETGAELSDLFVDPAAIGKRVGKALWNHLMDTARSLSIDHFLIHSDPYAEGFYEKMGAVRIGDIPSTVFPDRRLPLMKKQVAP